MRKTNNYESYHSQLNRQFYIPKPNIFNFVDELLKIELETQVKLRSTNQKKKSTLDKKHYLREQTTEYTHNTIIRLKFVQSLSFRFLPSAQFINFFITF
jgi:hypothetical protein